MTAMGKLTILLTRDVLLRMIMTSLTPLHFLLVATIVAMVPKPATTVLVIVEFAHQLVVMVAATVPRHVIIAPATAELANRSAVMVLTMPTRRIP